MTWPWWESWDTMGSHDNLAGVDSFDHPRPAPTPQSTENIILKSSSSGWQSQGRGHGECARGSAPRVNPP